MSAEIKALAFPSDLSLEQLRKGLEHIREIVRLFAPLTPTKYDDHLLTLLDFILGAPGTVQAKAIDLPMDQIIKFLLPIILQMFQKWLESIGKK